MTRKTAQFWDKIAEKYAKSPISDEAAYQYTLDRTRSYLSAEDSILELGCGTGTTALRLADSVKAFTASDISPQMINIAKRKREDQGAENIDFIAADILDVAIEKEPYDAVLAFNLLHLIEDLPQALERINGLIKPGGLFISKTICKPNTIASREFRVSKWFKYRMMMTILPVMQLLGMAPFVRIRTISTFENMLTAKGFKIIETGNYPAYPPSRYIVARKSEA